MRRGVSLVEILVALIMFVVLAVAFIGGVVNNRQLSFGANGLTELRCINGYQFVVGEGGQARQVLDAAGRGLRCEGI